ncbi:hypothetical protein [Streptomyces sp. NPDC001292]|uniref:hypothetical protein n=1 Tax=Streptomyces sp. NPDC001292 TaxID=3364558 RepID=UPI00368F3840
MSPAWRSARRSARALAGVAAREAVEQCRAALAAFEDAAIAAQAGAHPGIQSDENVLPASAKLRAE